MLIPLGSGRFIFGIFPEYYKGNVYELGIAGVIDNYILEVQQHVGTGPVPSGRSEERDYAIKELGQKRIAICKTIDDRYSRGRCITFVYFNDSPKSTALGIIVPGEQFEVYGHRVTIQKVTIGFTDDPTPEKDELPNIPILAQPRRTLVAVVPPGPNLHVQAPIYVSDFKRAKDGK